MTRKCHQYMAYAGGAQPYLGVSVSGDAANSSLGDK